MTLTPKNSGWIEVICGPMFSGKTEELIRRLVRSQIAQQKVTIFKPTLDDRYSEDYIVSHNKRKIKSLTVRNSSDIEKYSQDANVIGIDEAQFFDLDLVKICKKLAMKEKELLSLG
jgi:thymidine kinase